MAGPIYIFAGGGTGGHLVPGLAVAEELVGLLPTAKVVFACSDRPIDRRILDPTPYAVVPQPVRPMPRGRSGWPAFVGAYAASALQARQMVRDLRPAGALGLGGFAAAPLVCRAARRRVPTALLNPDAVPGRANRALARRVDAVFTQFAAAAEHFAPTVRRKVRTVGCPVRGSFAEAGRAEALEHFGLRPDRRTLLVNGGSQGAASINAAMGELLGDLAALADTWQVLHVTGPGKAGGQGAGGGGSPGVRVVEYCRRMDLAYAAADLALSRGGAATVAELAASGTPAVILPYPHHRDRHQRLNAQPLADAGAAVLCDEASDAAANAAALRRVLLPVLRDPDRLGRMQAASEALPSRDAAAAVARWLAACTN
jgi:UDP-N-acetylglucosamine--N-acetylmuramyl-(pentapeptide) pyrophosphoryl-undecaprenol N-acetylglucosamine transferase